MADITSDGTTRTTITLPRDLLRRLKVEAAQRGTSMNRVICQALEEHVEDVPEESARPKPRIFGTFDSGTSDTARRSAEERPEPRSWRS